MPSIKLIPPDEFASKIRVSTDFTRPGKGWVYVAKVVKEGRGYIKIGVSGDLKTRKQFNDSVYDKFEYIETFEYGTLLKAYVLEQYLHYLLSDYRGRFKKKFVGSTETYSMTVLDEISEIKPFFDELIKAVVVEDAFKKTVQHTKARYINAKAAKDKREKIAMENVLYMCSLKKPC